MWCGPVDNNGGLMCVLCVLPSKEKETEVSSELPCACVYIVYIVYMFICIYILFTVNMK